MNTQPLDLAAVRKEFPGLASDWILMDNAGGSQVLKGVGEKCKEYLFETNVQHGASYQVSQQAVERVSRANQAMATFVNATDTSEIIMGPSTSMLLRIFSWSLGELLQPGDEIIITNADHEANISPWHALQHKGIIIKEWQVNRESWRMELEDLTPLLTDQTKWVMMTHSSNVLGVVNPVREVADFVHALGVRICVDGVAYAPHKLVDVQALDVDVYVFSFYKVYGPHHALMYGKKEILLQLPGVNHSFIQETDIPYKFQPGNLNYELSYSTLGIYEYFLQMAEKHHLADGASAITQLRNISDLMAEHEHQLSSHLLGYLDSRPDVNIIGPSKADKDSRVPTISFIMGDSSSKEIVEKVDAHKIGIRYGDFYAKKLIQDLGLAKQQGVIRVSMVHYNSLEEVDRLIEVLEIL
ncbi:MAG: aminotransferase class V-fold PLP-dependent enzyme [Bacteroidota bacterium]